VSKHDEEPRDDLLALLAFGALNPHDCVAVAPTEARLSSRPQPPYHARGSAGALDHAECISGTEVTLLRRPHPRPAVELSPAGLTFLARCRFAFHSPIPERGARC